MSAKRRPANDVLFHILYGSDTTLVLEVLGACALRLAEISKSNHLLGAWEKIRLQPDLHFEKARGLLCLLINIDMPIKEYACSPSDPALWRKMFNLPEPKTDADREKIRARTKDMHSAVLLQCDPMCGKKATLFFKTIRGTTIPNWMHDERCNVADLVHSVRMEYIHC
jgi:hypothetical protein